jgi:hypothetical protein
MNLRRWRLRRWRVKTDTPYRDLDAHDTELNDEARFPWFRNGLRDHIREGCITSNDFAVYRTLRFYTD